MHNSIEEFIQIFSKAIIEGYAGVFAGAGLSVPSGYIDWKQLVQPFAQSVGLTTEKETDYLSIAQYYYNDRRNRSKINEEILNAYSKNVSQNENVKILTRLPISTYWTTNYDQLIEDSLRSNNRKADVKRTQEDLATNLYDRDAIVYKMHGDVHSPNQIVLLKDDYETYNLKRSLFTTALKGDLISKTFLFIGFSFEDPNLHSILAQIKSLLGENLREHFCFIKKIDAASEIDGEYKRAKQRLFIEDLKRYGIRAIMLDSYDQITKILQEIENRCYLSNVFLSGSMSVDQDGWSKAEAEAFAHELARLLIKENYKITSGFGLEIGSAVINGALEEIMQNKYKHVDEYLRLRPFPQIQTGNIPKRDLWTAYRKEMLQECGLAVFMFGNKVVENKVYPADGMIEEFKLARERGALIIPIASTGNTALQVYDQACSIKDEFPYLEKFWDELSTVTDPHRIVQIIIEISRN